MATTVTEQSFEEEVLQSDKPVIVDFWAEWCGPCHAVSPVLDRIVEERNGDLKLVKVNIDEQPALSQRFGVQSIPMMILFKNGEPTAAAVGAQPKAGLEKALGLTDAERLGALGLFFFGVRDGRDRPSRRLAHEVEHAHAVDEHDRAAEPAAESHQQEPDHRQRVSPAADVAVRVLARDR